MPTNSLGLDTLEPSKRGGKVALYTDDEWEQIHTAQKRGVSLRQIHEKHPRYKTLNTFNGALAAWRKKRFLP